MVVMEDPIDTEMVGYLQTFNAAIETAICPSGEIEILLKEIFDVWFDSR